MTHNSITFSFLETPVDFKWRVLICLGFLFSKINYSKQLDVHLQPHIFYRRKMEHDQTDRIKIECGNRPEKKIYQTK